MTLDVLFRSIGTRLRVPDHSTHSNLVQSLQLSDPSEGQILSANSFLDSIYADLDKGRGSRAQTPMVAGSFSRSQTPMMVGHPDLPVPGSFPISSLSESFASRSLYPILTLETRDSNQSFVSDNPEPVRPQLGGVSTSTVRLLPTIPEAPRVHAVVPSRLPFWNRSQHVKRTLTKTKAPKDSVPAPNRHLPARPSALPLQPDVSAFTTEVDQSTDYVVLVSMYEVYNDRIFDLLSSPMQPNAGPMTTRQGAALQKDLRRRPLLFKSTEMSPDRKVVAGLRKIVCGTYEEAMMILETGLAERRVAGTGSNTASSRSHGFFCIEVKRNNRFRQLGDDTWTGGVLSIVDLAGSERARNAKTTGSTLAEAGKINESLMYLGQCLQVQSEQHDGSKPIVPFRQCKLTELLFSNSYSAGSSHASRAPQKAIMIVTADPQGDFNATSQILRYSALAREVTVPRIPSITSTILNGQHHPSKSNGRQTPYGEQLFTAEELEQAANEIARLSEDCDQLAVRLAEEEIKRSEAELKLHAALQAAEEKALLIEQEVREECWAQMEANMGVERERWRKAKEEDRARAEGYLDGKIGILEKGVTIEVHEDRQQQMMEEVERENLALKRKVDALERQLNMRSPTKTKTSKVKALAAPLKENTNPTSNPFLSALRNSGVRTSRGESIAEDHLCSSLKTLDVQGPAVAVENSPRKASVPKTPGTAKKMRKLTTRKWDFGNSGDEEDF
jgi:Kinesin motor domain